MSLEITIRAAMDIRIVSVHGELISDLHLLTLKRAIANLKQSGVSKFAIDLTEVTDINETNVASLCILHVIITNDGQFKLFGPSDRAREILRGTTFATFEIFDDEAQALASFN